MSSWVIGRGDVSCWMLPGSFVVTLMVGRPPATKTGNWAALLWHWLWTVTRKLCFLQVSLERMTVKNCFCPFSLTTFLFPRAPTLSWIFPVIVIIHLSTRCPQSPALCQSPDPAPYCTPHSLINYVNYISSLVVRHCSHNSIYESCFAQWLNSCILVSYNSVTRHLRGYNHITD